ncbi:paraquat-inducible membrane protein A, partial [Methylococcaceae bacterium HT2]
GFVVLLTIILIPLIKMMLIIFITSRIYFKVKSQYLAASFKWYNRLNHWGMLDIFMLGIIVSAIKLNDDADLEAGVGLYAFIILLFTSALQTQLLNKNLIWTLIERHGE